ncbi:hypothetical protein FGO68_gene15807 [Halteria grandinella]|uniref:Uncharacterized protein n=1 Tax=Halteria grandinella TaxID=5974 RepID=A0A8J8T4A7_HALGN|nr:hypothetical protein FGO68_gene15807 [Halteria grandinella]
MFKRALSKHDKTSCSGGSGDEIIQGQRGGACGLKNPLDVIQSALVGKFLNLTQEEVHGKKAWQSIILQS